MNKHNINPSDIAKLITEDPDIQPDPISKDPMFAQATTDQTGHFYFETYVYANEDEDGNMEVDDEDFINAVREEGVDPSAVVSSWAEADQDGYAVFVKVKGEAPSNMRVPSWLNAQSYEQGLLDNGRWPEGG